MPGIRRPEAHMFQASVQNALQRHRPADVVPTDSNAALKPKAAVKQLGEARSELATILATLLRSTAAVEAAISAVTDCGQSKCVEPMQTLFNTWESHTLKTSACSSQMSQLRGRLSQSAHVLASLSQDDAAYGDSLVIPEGGDISDVVDTPGKSLASKSKPASPLPTNRSIMSRAATQPKRPGSPAAKRRQIAAHVSKLPPRAFENAPKGKTFPRAALLFANTNFLDVHRKNSSDVSCDDANSVAKALRMQEFQTLQLDNGDIDQMDKAATTFLSSVDQQTVVLFFYTGYGIQVMEDGRPHNYLVGKDDVFRSVADIQRKAFPLTRFMMELEKRNPLLSVIVLDACRHRPVPAGVSRGLAPPSYLPASMVVMFSAAANCTTDNYSAIATQQKSSSNFARIVSEVLGHKHVSAKQFAFAVGEVQTSNLKMIGVTEPPFTALSLNEDEIRYPPLTLMRDAKSSWGMDVLTNPVLNLRNKVHKASQDDQLARAEMAMLTAVIAQSKDLVSLDVGCNEIHCKGRLQILLPFISAAPALRTLRLSNNPLGVEGAKMLASFIATNSTITDLDVSFGAFTGVHYTVQGQKRGTYNSFGALALVEAMKVNQSINTLNLGGNDLGNDVGLAVLDDLFKTNSTLNTLEIRWNSFKEGVNQRFKSISDGQVAKSKGSNKGRARSVRI